MIVKTDKFTIYFGNVQDDISKPLDCIPSSGPLAAHEKFSLIAQKLGVDHLAFLNQTHSIQGMLITDQIPAFTTDGDFLITKKNNLGIGVMTADCLPIALYDSKNHVAAVIHAGWRGSVAGITQEVIGQMRTKIGSYPSDLQVFFGPSAKVCCYQVENDFKKMWFDTIASQSLTTNGLTLSVRPECEQRERTRPAKPWRRRIEGSEDIFISRDNKIYFDLPLFNARQLQELGVAQSAISDTYNFCTICDQHFFSYRRQGGLAGRQMSIISLHA